MPPRTVATCDSGIIAARPVAGSTELLGTTIPATSPAEVRTESG